MAFEKSISSRYGVDATYWRLGVKNVNALGSEGRMEVFGYADKAARDAGADPLPGMVEPFDIDATRFRDLALSSVLPTIQAIVDTTGWPQEVLSALDKITHYQMEATKAYVVIKDWGVPGVDDEGNPIMKPGKFADAEDV